MPSAQAGGFAGLTGLHHEYVRDIALALEGGGWRVINDLDRLEALFVPN